MEADCDGGNCVVDGTGVDAMLTCNDPGGPICDTGQICLGSQCVTNTCDTDNPCGPDDTCAMTCVPSHDRCEGVVCGEDMTCVDGQCIAGCFPPSACLNTHCADSEFLLLRSMHSQAAVRGAVRGRVHVSDRVLAAQPVRTESVPGPTSSAFRTRRTRRWPSACRTIALA